MRILVAAASKHGSTWEIAQVIGDTLSIQGVSADVLHIENVGDMTPYDGFVVGSAVYAGRWLSEAATFVRQRGDELNSRPVWLFSSGPLGFSLRPQKSRAVDIRKVTELVRIKEHHVFAGKLKKRRLDLAEKVIAAVVHAPQGDFRNWAEIRAWAGGIALSLKRQSTVAHTPTKARGKN